MDTPFIQFEGIHKAFGPKKVLQGVTLDIRQRRDDGGAGRQRQRQVRPAPAHHRAAPARPGTSDRGWRGHHRLRRGRAGPCAPEVVTPSVAFLSTISATVSCTNFSSGIAPRSFSVPRARTLTLPSSSSRGPTMSWYGTFSSAATLILAWMRSLPSSSGRPDPDRLAAPPAPCGRSRASSR